MRSRADGASEPTGEDAPRPGGFPDGFGEGPGEADAVLRLAGLRGSSPRKLHELVWRTGSASGAVHAIERGVAGSQHDRAFLLATSAADLRTRVRSCGARFAPAGDTEYWPAFVRLADPPVGIFLRGRPLLPGDRRVAVVGSRRPSPLGVEVGRSLARGIVRGGLIVTSGGALGIDARAHEGALEADGATVAVLGSGIDVPYPATNRALLDRIALRGTVVSEYAPGVPAEPFRFPARNRLIAGLSIGVVIVEGVARSGTRSTADFAVQLGIDVFAVPGAVTSALSEAPNSLIRDGARLIRGVQDLLDDLGVDPADALARGIDGLPGDQSAVLAALDVPALPEAVARATGLSFPDTVAALTQLEIRGLISGSGGRFRRAFDRAAPSPADAAASDADPEEDGDRHPSG